MSSKNLAQMMKREYNEIADQFGIERIDISEDELADILDDNLHEAIITDLLDEDLYSEPRMALAGVIACMIMVGDINNTVIIVEPDDGEGGAPSGKTTTH